MTLLLRDVESLYTPGVMIMVTDSLKYHSVELLVCLLLLLMRETLEVIDKVINTSCWHMSHHYMLVILPGFRISCQSFQMFD